MRFEDLFLYDGMMHVFAFNYDLGPKTLTFNLQLSDHPRKRNASFRERLEANEIHPQSEVVNVKLRFEDIIYMEVIDESYADGVVVTPHDQFEGHQNRSLYKVRLSRPAPRDAFSVVGVH